MKRSLSVLVLVFISFNAYADEGLSANLAKCTDIADKVQRLECFDRVAGTPHYEEPIPSRFAINQSEPPTCYIAKHGPAACSPTHQCDAKETGIKSIENGSFSCYILGSTPNCCSFCPPEWSGNC